MSLRRKSQPVPATDTPTEVVATSFPLPERLTLRLDELAESLGISRRGIERERSAGRFPPPDLTVGRMPLWRPATINEWIDRRGGQ